MALMVADVARSTSISTVWARLGGGELRRHRGRAFWRDGDGWAVSINDEKGTWFDHRDGIGGGVLDLIQHVRGASRQDALRWLASMVGFKLDDPPMTRQCRADWLKQQRITREAVCFASAAWVLAEERLEALEPWDPERAVYSRLFTALRICPEAEYRKWREHCPELAAALVHAGRKRQHRLQSMLARYLMITETHAAQRRNQR